MGTDNRYRRIQTGGRTSAGYSSWAGPPVRHPPCRSPASTAPLAGRTGRSGDPVGRELVTSAVLPGSLDAAWVKTIAAAVGITLGFAVTAAITRLPERLAAAR